MFLVVMENEKNVGFISIKENNKYTYEIYVMGILEEYQRKGLGRKLIEKGICEIKKKGIQYLLVKTLNETRKSEEYNRTKLFYLEMGFIPIDVIEDFWGKENPCLLLIRRIEDRPRHPWLGRIA